MKSFFGKQTKTVVYHTHSHNSGVMTTNNRKMTPARLGNVDTRFVQSIPCWSTTANGKPLSMDKIRKMSNAEKSKLVFLGFKYIYHQK